MSTIKRRLFALFQAHPGVFLSGEEAAKELECSRAAIWKHVKELQSEGFAIEAVNRKGYRLVSVPEAMTENSLLAGMETTVFGQFVHLYEALPSTQTRLLELVQQGAPEGTIVLTNEQTSGRGRLQRAWHGGKNKNIAMSVLVKPNLPLHIAPQLTLLMAVAVADALEAVTDVSCQIKWPNDVHMSTKKVAGILTETISEPDRVIAAIIGIGINVNEPEDAFPEDIRNKATSLVSQTGKEFSRMAVVQHICSSFERLYSAYRVEGFDPIRLLWEARAETIGKRVSVQGVDGVVTGLSTNGSLKVKAENGIEHQVYTTDIGH
ncbi:biotin--[acetyl-CoA-carboxylase] ligase [Aureibacillus halotolerans]|uniref:Bifunctional ligase/repressor BirA n=1 Tax=Aureibacillus halotolerans TaxID=1508390 RepID=A0A4R6U957_9BACI|nr:biotin--[acetyl-CoA-carboxylase] ligase [Aureibacillus halotolerans]TDQ41503.1 BirA family biotin operon repressor/biotin-[acetyl-CoA-carboxylase] ligase [Aureibacillus halotolerans]